MRAWFLGAVVNAWYFLSIAGDYVITRIPGANNALSHSPPRAAPAWRVTVAGERSKAARMLPPLPDLPIDPLPLQVLLPWLDLAGLAVFAASGALAAARKRLDFVGACFFALITATGGGTLRDLLIRAPVFWMQAPTPVLLCIGVALAAWAIPLKWWPERALDWLDGAGLAAYAVYGAGKALQYGISPVPAVAAGVITACLGGVIRDITAGVPSILLRHELYVTAALGAATLFVVLTTLGLPAPIPAMLGFLAGFALRGAAILWKITLPAHRGA
ncbi:putative membrane protein YeiH [Novosphingobium fluoreni]|uniref:Putative membrane protein YeiH n=1 Tax=Novosphingobium fluoreni TaxID=1391222 RepID=A0A7W6FY92_9SPHN|nr:putative membrane protein YeiH [Novosphingobium fluoreni]